MTMLSVTVYDGAGHAFMRDGAAAHVSDVAADASSRTLGHFAEHLDAKRAA
jgi:dienelactone hydrolase